MLTFTIQIQNAKSFSEETGEFKETVHGHVTCSSRKMSWSLASLLSREKSGSPGASLLSVCAIWRDPTTLSEAGYTCKTFLYNITVTQICAECQVSLDYCSFCLNFTHVIEAGFPSAALTVFYFHSLSTYRNVQLPS